MPGTVRGWKFSGVEGKQYSMKQSHKLRVANALHAAKEGSQSCEVM